MADIVVYGFETSNNMKVRVALGYKGIQYEWKVVDPSQRDELVRISGQFLTPVLVHGDRVVSDSAAILRYLDCEFRDGPRLFGTTMAEQWEIEDWELFARAVLAGPMMEVVHSKKLGKPVDDATFEQCSARFADSVDRVANGLLGRSWLVGETMTAADITVAAVLHRIRVGELFPMPASFETLAPWVDRVMALM